ncbi:MAG: HEAT repeat domain-containing protein [Myxococcales bacterium]|nr:HEAT repeat domain-containing protein [Myxococcales bacterium]
MEPAEVDALLAAEHAEQRRQAVLAMVKLDPSEVVPRLLRALGDSDWRVREEAQRIGANLAIDEALLSALIGAVAQPDNVGLRNAALALLGALGERASSALLDAFKAAEPTARKFVVEAIAGTGDRRAVPLLSDVAVASDLNDAAGAIEALGRIGGAEAEAALRRVLGSQEVYLRMAALQALDRMRVTLPWEQLEPLLSERLVFRVALSALGRTGHVAAVAPLLSALAESSSRLAAMAAGALCELAASEQGAEAVARGMLGLGQDARSRLRELALEGEGEAARAAVELLCRARDPEVLPAVVECACRNELADGAEAAIRAWGYDAARALLSLYQTDVDAPRAPATLELGSDLAASLSSGAVTAAFGGQPGGDFVVELRGALRAAMQSRQSELMAAATRAMAQWAEPGDAGRLVALAGSSHAEVCEAARLALTALVERDSEAVGRALLGVNLEGPSGQMLVELIARTGGEAAFDRLRTALLAPDPATRSAAIRALSRLHGLKVGEAIAMALTDESSEVQLVAAEALGGLLQRGEGSELLLQSLLVALDGPAPQVQEAAARALRWAEAGSEVDDALSHWAQAGGAELRVIAIDALVARASPLLGAALERALQDGEPKVVKKALNTYAVQGPSDPSTLIAALEHPLSEIRRVAIDLLLRRGDDRALAALFAHRERESDDVLRQKLGDALAELGRGH